MNIQILAKANTQILSIILPVALIGVFLIFMMMKNKNKPKMEETVAAGSTPEHIALIKKWLKEKKNLTHKHIKMEFLRDIPAKNKDKESRSKELYILMFKTYDSKTRITSDPFAIEVEAVRERVSKTEYKTKYVVTQELDPERVTKDYIKDIEHDKKHMTKEEARNQKILEKQRAKLEKIKRKANKKSH